MERAMELNSLQIELDQEFVNGFNLFEADSYQTFSMELKENLSLEMSEEEQATQVILSALRIEFGPGFHRDSQLVKVIKDAMLNDQDKMEEVGLVANNLCAPVKSGKRTKPVN